MKLAIVTEDLSQYGGAERVLEVLHELFPSAPVYASLYEPTALPPALRQWDIRTSFLQRIPGSHRLHRALLLLYPTAYESFDLSHFDVVLSISSRFANGVITPPGTLHINYCLTPMRFAWNYREYVERERLGRGARALLPAAMHYLRLWDVAASQRVDRFVGISSVVQARIKKYYRRDAAVIFPPVDAADIPFGVGGGDNFLVVSRLAPYKRIDLAVAASAQAGVKLTVVGEGRDRASLAAVAGPLVRFTGRLSDADARAMMGTARGFVFPGYEDFGITPLESMAAGTPVIAYGAGGTLDTMVDRVTGRLFHEQTVDALAQQLTAFDPADFDRRAIREHALKFDRSIFARSMGDYIHDAWASFSSLTVAPANAASV